MLLTRLDIKESKAGFWLVPRQANTKYSGGVEALATKGNEGKRVTDPHTCCICGKELAYRESLKKHIEGIHFKMERHCDLCPKVFFSREALNRHMLNYHSKKRLVCGFCGYKTASKYIFKNHMQIHGKDSSYKCYICNKIVASRETHMQLHFPKKASISKTATTGVATKSLSGTRIRKGHGCRECDTTFDSFEGLRR